MTAAILDPHPEPWTEEEFLDLGETGNRIELLDGNLIVGPAPTGRHQSISHELTSQFKSAIKATGMKVLEGINLRLKSGRIAIPDLTVLADGTDIDVVVFEAADALLVGEIVSPGNAATDRVVKMQLYAIARIPRYLLIEPDSNSVTLRLYRLDGEHYVQHAVATAGEPLEIGDPFRLTLDPAHLLE